jgi:dTDP-4-dehydrorhamnose 3,5-epimerase
MEIIKSKIFEDVMVFIPKIYSDNRGFFCETFNTSIQETLGVDFPQENHSKSKKNVLRGIHFQSEKPMGKLCRVIKGSGFDFLLDLRTYSDTYGQYELVYLSEDNFKQVWVPPGFGHAFLSLQDDTHLVYRCSSIFNPNSEGTINPLDENLKIDWPINPKDLILSTKDFNAPSFKDYQNNPKF